MKDEDEACLFIAERRPGFVITKELSRRFSPSLQCQSAEEIVRSQKLRNIRLFGCK